MDASAGFLSFVRVYSVHTRLSLSSTMHSFTYILGRDLEKHLVWGETLTLEIGLHHRGRLQDGDLDIWISDITLLQGSCPHD